jgi:hypothetical protein
VRYEVGYSYVVTLPAGTYELGIAPDATPDDNADGDLDIWSTVTIIGNSSHLGSRES